MAAEVDYFNHLQSLLFAWLSKQQLKPVIIAVLESINNPDKVAALKRLVEQVGNENNMPRFKRARSNPQPPSRSKDSKKKPVSHSRDRSRSRRYRSRRLDTYGCFSYLVVRKDHPKHCLVLFCLFFSFEFFSRSTHSRSRCRVSLCICEHACLMY